MQESSCFKLVHVNTTTLLMLTLHFVQKFVNVNQTDHWSAYQQCISTLLSLNAFITNYQSHIFYYNLTARSIYTRNLHFCDRCNANALGLGLPV